ncbi:putative AA1-like domain-containing protein [Seiridium cardinale]|uniref:AA1-like domain-containing protein n=1 Tax=Seiridium cardinale TaxID=138064 RepID=A0ABR2XHK1_9PEZI
MRFANIIGLATLAAGATLEKKQTPQVTIQDFSADCTPHSAICSYSFQIAVAGVQAPIHCNDSLVGSGVLPVSVNGVCYDDSAWNWWITKTLLSSSYFFNVEWKSPFTNDLEIFCHEIPPDQIITQNDGASTSQHYVGPTSFTAAVNGCF